MNEKIKAVLKLAVAVVETRDGDVLTENGYMATTEADAIIELEAALCDAFDTSSDNATSLEINSKINQL